MRYLLAVWASFFCFAAAQLQCKQKLEPGPCKALFTRWGSHDGNCVEFIYGGCGGNSNNFRTKTECLKHCPNIVTLPHSTTTTLPPATTTKLPQTTATTRPSPITTTQLQPVTTTELPPGNLCQLELEPGPCRASLNRWGSKDGECVPFQFGGCGGNANNFRSVAECKEKCQSGDKTRCAEPITRGRCYGYFPSWGYRDGQCVSFIFGGCQGTANRFNSKSDCENTCLSSVTPPSTILRTDPLDICQLPLTTGSCEAFTRLWGSRNGECVLFTYGGCQGNANRFSTREECERACPPVLTSSAPTTEWPPVGICQLPLEIGPCRASFTRWGSRNGTCVQFIYGGCDGNDNNFGSRADCVRVCNPPVTPILHPPTTQTPVDRCQLPLETGPCRASFTRWGSRNGECVEFNYGGCEGNKNNFRSKGDCELSCPPTSSLCSLPVESGRCYANFPRWASVDGQCTRFVYGGCGGNENNFRTVDECEVACPSQTRQPPAPTTELTPADRCQLALETGPCQAAFRRWGSKNGECVEFIYGGCRGNDNRFRSKADCERACDAMRSSPPAPTTEWPPVGICQLPLEIGPCRASFTRWGSRNGTCVQFIYGGCEGNDNNFGSRADCVRVCNPPVTPILHPPTTQTPVDRCQLPLETGPCRASFTRWGSRNGECVEFTYGGCDGNKNNFRSKGDCELSCPPTSSLCSLPVESGRCYANFPRWASVDGQCRRFVYGGCGGNENNFRTVDECEVACPSQTRQPHAPTTELTPADKCQLPLETGPCQAAFRRWGSRNGECVEFIYGGCRGNDNRFRSQADCERTCDAVRSSPPAPTTEWPPVGICQLPLETGPCRASFTRWGSRNSTCVQFIYGGCEGNDNNFGSRADCVRVCNPPVTPMLHPPTTQTPVDRCQLPLETGPCRASITRWGSKNGECVEFTYGGCGRNSNHFRSLEECMDVCHHLVSPLPPTSTTELSLHDRCQLPLETGPCRASFTRWGSRNGECVEFTFGGCDGNDNNFRNKEACERSCKIETPQSDSVCSLPVNKGLCRGRFPSWGYQGGNCVNFNYGGCGGNDNRFRTREACERVCVTNPPDPIRKLTPTEICRQPLESGPCARAEVRWGNKDGVCRKFTYGGCRGNTNNFRSQAECIRTCQPPTHPTEPPVVDVCQLPIITGHCKALLYRWGKKNGECIPFIYGGCAGNANNFKTKLECDQKCMRPAQPIAERCTQPIAPGPCKARYPSWGYKNGECVKFVYSGCRGNSNRFATKKGCISQCEKHSKPKRCIALPVDQRSSCLPGKLKWFYNGEKDGCEKSSLSICKKAKYNAFFRSKVACEKLCKDAWP